PIMMLIFLPYMGVIIFSSNEAVMAVLSYIPFSAAVAVPMRVFLGTIEWWEPLVSLAVLMLATPPALLLATRTFEGAILRSGPKLSWGQALKSSSWGGSPGALRPAVLAGDAGGIGAVAGVRLPDRRWQSVADRARGEEERRGDLPDARPVGGRTEHFGLPLGQGSLPVHRRFDDELRVDRAQ